MIKLLSFDMQNLLYMLMCLSVILSACGQAPTIPPTPTDTETPTSTETFTLLPTATATLTPTPSYPLEGYGPTAFPAEVDPLTGLKVIDPALLDRRPMLIEVTNTPRNARPQWGLSLADVVFEYYSEAGFTHLAAIFYGKDASMVGPIRSGRFIDGDLADGYKAVFAVGSAGADVWKRFTNSDFANRLVVEGPNTPLTRYDPKGSNYLMVNSADLSVYATKNAIGGKQNLDGMFFNLSAPAGGQPGRQAFVDYSPVIYDRWDYDPASDTYLRFSDTADVTSAGQTEQYAPLTDRLANQPVAFDNVVFLYVNHDLYSPDIYDILLTGSGDAYAFRDGQAYQVKWQRKDTEVVSLINQDGTAFAFKPGTTWFEVVGLSSPVTQTDQNWHFTHMMP